MAFRVKASDFNKKSKTQKTLVCNTGEAIEVHFWYHPFLAGVFLQYKQPNEDRQRKLCQGQSQPSIDVNVSDPVKMNSSAIYSYIYG